MSQVYADLHTHSHYSDSSESVHGVVSLAKASGLRCLSITDHDTLKGQIHALHIGNELGVQVICGIEISAYDFEEHRKVHILGYYADPEDRQIDAFCEPVRRQRHSATMALHDHFIKIGYRCDWDSVVELARPGTTAYRQHLIKAIMSKLNTNGDRNVIFGRLRAECEAEKREITYVDVRDAVRFLVERGAVPVVAHPALYGNLSNLQPLIDAGLKGIEAYHSHHTTNDVRACKEAAARHGILVTGGTDFHGEYDPTVKSPGKVGMLKVEFERLALRGVASYG